jgi:predicted GIY-YIG superfamily endonuclease
MSDLDYIVYLLTNSCNNCTYIGITNNPERRLRQHNKEIIGGAKYTSCKKGSGSWEYYGFIPGLDKSLALSLEKKIHIHSRKMNGSSPVEKRINYINKLLLNYQNLFFIKL